MKKDLFLQVSNKNIQKIDYSRKGLIRSKYILKKSVIQSFQEVKVGIRHRNLFLIIEDEEIHIKLMNIPRVDFYNLDLVIINRLKYLYGEKSEEILYTYTILREKEQEIEILLFCINCEKLNVLSSLNKLKISKITLIQICFLNYFKKLISHNDYLFLFKHKTNLYLLAISKGNVIGSKIIEENYIHNISNDIDYLFNKLIGHNSTCNKIYIVNFEDKNITNYIDNNKYDLVNLGDISEDKILEYFIINRRQRQ